MFDKRDTDGLSMIRINLAKLQFTLQCSSRIILPEYAGSTFRGVLGHGLKLSVCPIPGVECSNCRHKGNCLYSYIFETPPPENTQMMRLYPAAPHPFVIEPPMGNKRYYEPGDKLEFGMVLIGKAIELFPYFFLAFKMCGEEFGIGKGRGHFKIHSIHCLDQENKRIPIYSIHRNEGLQRLVELIPGQITNESTGEFPTTIKIEFTTPVKIQHAGRNARKLDFHVLLRSLLRRASMLSYFHCDTKLDLDYRALIKQAESVETVECHIGRFSWNRHSARQNRKISIQSAIGQVQYHGDFKPFLPLLKLGTYIHVGKGAVMGMGAYNLFLYGGKNGL